MLVMVTFQVRGVTFFIAALYYMLLLKGDTSILTKSIHQRQMLFSSSGHTFYSFSIVILK